jgi:hypothetical protein
MMFQRKYFWFGSEPVQRDFLEDYLRGEKDQELAERNAALSSSSGKGLLYFSKTPKESKFPAGIFNLVCSKLAKHE